MSLADVFRSHENHNWTLRESFMLRWVEWGNNTKQNHLNLLESENKIYTVYKNKHMIYIISCSKF